MSGGEAKAAVAAGLWPRKQKLTGDKMTVTGAQPEPAHETPHMHGPAAAARTLDGLGAVGRWSFMSPSTSSRTPTKRPLKPGSSKKPSWLPAGVFLVGSHAMPEYCQRTRIASTACSLRGSSSLSRRAPV